MEAAAVGHDGHVNAAVGQLDALVGEALVEVVVVEEEPVEVVVEELVEVVVGGGVVVGRPGPCSRAWCP